MRSSDALKKKRRALKSLVCIVWARAFGSALGTTIKLVCSRGMSTNVYIFMLQFYKHLSEYLSIRLLDLDAEKDLPLDEQIIPFLTDETVEPK